MFDFVEFLIRHPGCSDELKRELAAAFVDSRAAYRVFDNKYIAAIGTQEQAGAFERAMAEAERQNATGARKQLIQRALRCDRGIGQAVCAKAFMR